MFLSPRGLNGRCHHPVALLKPKHAVTHYSECLVVAFSLPRHRPRPSSSCATAVCDESTSHEWWCFPCLFLDITSRQHQHQHEHQDVALRMCRTARCHTWTARPPVDISTISAVPFHEVGCADFTSVPFCLLSLPPPVTHGCLSTCDRSVDKSLDKLDSAYIGLVDHNPQACCANTQGVR